MCVLVHLGIQEAIILTQLKLAILFSEEDRDFIKITCVFRVKVVNLLQLNAQSLIIYEFKQVGKENFL